MLAATPSASPVATPLLAVRGLRKSYGETKALRHCDLIIRPGTVHALIGENGSGKSTLVKTLSGVVTPDGGTIDFGSKSGLQFASPRAARTAGIATTFQEVLVIEDLSLLDNLWLGQDGLLRWHVAPHRRQAEALALLGELLGEALPDLDARMADLDLGTRQAAVIARSLLLDPRLLILDEATAALDIAVRDRLFAALRRRTDNGLAILFITHKMDEIAAFSDEVTVLRSGESVATMPIAEATPSTMLRLMSGRSAETTDRRPHAADAKNILAVRELRLAVDASKFDLDIRSGEVLGLAGLEGHGADLFSQIIGGVRTGLWGDVVQADRVLRRLDDFVRGGVAYVPRDRKREGIFAPLSIADNFSIATLGRHRRLGLIDENAIAARRNPIFAQLSVKANKLSDAITSLSGGNQQKVILARMLALDPRVLVLNDPTRGVDLSTKQDIYGLLAAQAAAGAAVVIHSTEVEELLALCHRVAIFHHGSLFKVLTRDELSREALVAGLFGRDS